MNMSSRSYKQTPDPNNLSSHSLSSHNHSKSRVVVETDLYRDEITELEKELKLILENHEIRQSTSFLYEIFEKEKYIEKLKSEGKVKRALERQESLDDLKRLQPISQRIGELNIQLCELMSRREIEDLEKELNDGLVNNDMKDLGCLGEEIEQMRKQVVKFKNEGKEKRAGEAQESLEDLERLQAISIKVENIKTEIRQKTASREIEILEKDLIEGLRQHEISEPGQLSVEVEERRKNIIQLEAKGKPKKVRERKASLEDLQRLMSVVEKIEVLKSKMIASSVPTKIDNPQQESKATLDRHDIKNFDKPKNEIENRKTGITKLESEEEVKEVTERKNSLEDSSKMIKSLDSTKIDNLEQELKAGFDEHDIHDPSELKKEIENRKVVIMKLESEGKVKKAAERKKSLKDLERLEEIARKIEGLKTGASSSIINKEIEDLQKELVEGLERHDLNENEIEEKIEATRKVILKLEGEGKPKKAKEKKDELEDLEHLYRIRDRIRTLKSGAQDKSGQVDIQELERELIDGLKRRDLSDPKKLEEEIVLKKEEINKLEKAGKPKKAQERRDSLEDLENLKKIYEKIEGVKFQTVKNGSAEEIRALEKVLEDGLDRHDLKEVGELEGEIEAKKKEIIKLEKEEKFNRSLERKSSMEDLEKLVQVSKKVEMLKARGERK